MKNLIQTLILSTAVLGTAAVYAGEGHDGQYGQGREGKPYLHHMMKKLDLTEEQKAAIAEIHRAHPRGDHQSHKRELMRELSQLDPAASDYQSQVAAIAKEQAAKVEQAIIARGQTHAKVYAVLTPEQRAQWQEMKSKRREKFKDAE